MGRIEDDSDSGTAEAVDKLLKEGLFNPQKNQTIEGLLKGFLQSDCLQTPVGFLEFMDLARTDPIASSDEEVDLIKAMTCRDVLNFVESRRLGLSAETAARNSNESFERRNEWSNITGGIFREAAKMEMRRDQFRKHYKRVEL